MEEERRKEEMKKEEETYTLKNLCKRDDTIITKADKGVVVTIVDDDVQEANQQLNNKDLYKKKNKRHN